MNNAGWLSGTALLLLGLMAALKLGNASPRLRGSPSPLKRCSKAKTSNWSVRAF
jgi:hypothetical protein